MKSTVSVVGRPDTMNIFLWIFIILAIVILIGCIRKGVRKGFVHELNALLTLLCATLIFNLATGLLRDYASGDISAVFVGVLLVVIVVVAYSLFHLLFSAIHIFARLPVIRIIDSILGLAAGAVEGFLTLYLVDALLRYFVA